MPQTLVSGACFAPGLNITGASETCLGYACFVSGLRILGTSETCLRCLWRSRVEHSEHVRSLFQTQVLICAYTFQARQKLVSGACFALAQGTSETCPRCLFQTIVSGACFALGLNLLGTSETCLRCLLCPGSGHPKQYRNLSQIFESAWVGIRRPE